ncbi:glycosyltransferase [Nocardioides mesophilus]|uniref:Glycosyltransferase n=2 Tax=Nocardioides mesophilus TaxID=433659 RepID=A0A7G9REF8_9ACTN|nr:glycosyltransferase [Nocardioides mesophilus]
MSAYGRVGIRVIEVPEPLSGPGATRTLRQLGGEATPLHVTAPGLLPLKKDRAWICSVQDTIPLDLREYQRFGIRSRLHYMNASRAEVVFANSRHTQERFSKFVGRRSQAIKFVTAGMPVTTKPISSSEPLGRGVGEDYVAAMVDLRTPDPRKRMHWLEPIAEEVLSIGLTLRVTGRGLDRLPALAPHAVPTETPDDESLWSFLAGARAFVYTSAYEGQGLPPLEAMALGTPVVAFANSSVQEVVGDSGGLISDPRPWQSASLDAPLPKASASAIAREVRRLEDAEYRHRRSVASRRQARLFSEANFDAAVRACLKAVT